MQQNIKRFIAAASELQSSDIYMTVKMVMFTVPGPDYNGTRCTEEFLDDIVENQFEYLCIPLCVDRKRLDMWRYAKLGHCYDEKTDKFDTEMIGSFYKFEKEKRQDGTAALIGYARIMKRNHDVCKAISEMFAIGELKFSFEISCGEYAEYEDGTILIDRSEYNKLEGMCIVSYPACDEAVAMQLVAEKHNRDEANEMPEDEKIVIDKEEKPVDDAQHKEECAEEVEAEKAEAECGDHKEAEAQDDENAPCENEELNCPDKEPDPEHENAECGEPDDENGKEEDEEIDAACDKKQGFENENVAEILKNIMAAIDSMKMDLDNIKKQKKVEAEKKDEPDENVGINPFVNDMAIKTKKYSLLDSAEEKFETYSLLQ